MSLLSRCCILHHTNDGSNSHQAFIHHPHSHHSIDTYTFSLLTLRCPTHSPKRKSREWQVMVHCFLGKEYQIKIFRLRKGGSDVSMCWACSFSCILLVQKTRPWGQYKIPFQLHRTFSVTSWDGAKSSAYQLFPLTLVTGRDFETSEGMGHNIQLGC